MKSKAMKKMKKRIVAMLLCMALVVNGGITAWASDLTNTNEIVSVNHEHIDGCYTYSKASEDIICGQEETEGHAHGETCYEVVSAQELVCTQEETEEHAHGEECYQTTETTTLICEMAEVEAHTHDDGCYEWIQELVCTIENIAEVQAVTEEIAEYTATEETVTDETEVGESEGEVIEESASEETEVEETEESISEETEVEETEESASEETEVEETEESVAEETEVEEATDAEPIALTTEVDGTTITLSGPTSSFAEGKTYAIAATKVEAEEEIEVIEEAIEEVAAEQKKVIENYQAFDIKIFATDENGNTEEFQPLGPVQVTFSSKEVAESVENENTETSVLHVDAKTGETQDMGAIATEEKDVAIETTHFSIYVYVELVEIEEITLIVEHWIENSNEKLYSDSEIVLENGFKGAVENLGELCYKDQVDIGYKVSKVYRNVSNEWIELKEDIILTEDAKLKVEYAPISNPVPISEHPTSIGGTEQGIKINKTATPLTENDQTDVTLSVPGKAQDYTSDIVLIIGNGPANNYKYLVESIKKMLIATDGTPTKIKLGFVGFADTTEEENVLPLTVMQDVVLDNDVADYRIKGRYNDGKVYTETEEAYLARKAAHYEEWETANPLLLQDMEYIIAKALERAEDVYSGINLESSLITARDMLAADTTVPASRKHMIVVSTGQTYWFDNDNGEPVTIIGTNSVGNYMHGNKYWLQARDGSTNTSAGYYLNDTWMSVKENGVVNYQKSWTEFWNKVVSWIDADQDAYVYNPGKTYSDFYYNGNSTEIKPNNNTNLRYGSAIQNSEDLAKVTGAVPYFPGKADPATNANAAHALNYERAQYESWVVYNQMQTPIGQSFETVLKDENGNYKVVNGLGYNCYSIAIGVSSNPGEEDRWLASNQIGYNFMHMLGGGSTVNYRDGDTSFFKTIENKILYSCSIGSTVEDYIGYDAEKGNFEFIQDPEVISLSVGDITYTTKRTDDGTNEKVSTYSFTAPGATEPTFWLNYDYGNGTTTEKFIWTFGENVSRYIPVALTYKLQLTEKAEVEGHYEIDTNIEATLYPKDSEGKDGTPEIFPIPYVEYDVVNSKVIRILKTDSSTDKNPLVGAEFKVYKVISDETLEEMDINPETPELEVITTDDNGQAEFEIKYGTYILKEVKAPNGYLLSDTEYVITYNKETGICVQGVSKVEELDDEVTVQITIENLPLYELPSTGGFGIFQYTIGGVALLMSASLMLYRRKRKLVLRVRP